MRSANGFTLIEVMMALSILLVVLVGLATTTARTVHIVATSDRQEAAIQLVHDRIELVRTDPRYAVLDSLYAGVETGFPTLTGFQRVTEVVRVTSGADSYARITVTVSGPGLAGPVARTVTVGAP